MDHDGQTQRGSLSMAHAGCLSHLRSGLPYWCYTIIESHLEHF